MPFTIIYDPCTEEQWHVNSLDFGGGIGPCMKTGDSLSVIFHHPALNLNVAAAWSYFTSNAHACT
jgi:hypothetical protein